MSLSDHTALPPTREEKLETAGRGILTCCRECHAQEPPVVTPADFILWGKLISPEGLGPKCYDHAAKHIGHAALSPSQAIQYALVDLRPLRKALDG